ncbi:helix-turn-helix domain-containing protein [Aquicoccus sp. SCR17]|nr:helix-turn-helix domain-containing protein [Carideicomes alvinocaridis]
MIEATRPRAARPAHRPPPTPSAASIDEMGAEMNRSNTDSTKRDVLRRLPSFGGLPPDLLAELGAICRLRSYRHDQLIAEEGERLSFVGFISGGILRLQKPQADGRLSIVGLMVEGDMFGRIFNGALHFTLAATGDVEICAFSRELFEELATRWPELERLVMLNILNELDSAREWMLILTSYRVTERLAGFLLLICRRWTSVAKLVRVDKGRLRLTIPVNRTDLAHFLATRPESLSRAFHALADDGLIRLHTPYEIEILDLPALLDLSGSEDLFTPGSFEDLFPRQA